MRPISVCWGRSPSVQRFVLQENIKLLNARLAGATCEDELRRLRTLLADMARELARLDAMETGVLGPAARMARMKTAEARADLVAWFRREYARSPKLAALIDPSPGLVFVEANAAYGLATGLTHDEIVGQSLFARFPENPDNPAADGMQSLYLSFRKVAQTGRPDVMEVLRYDVQDDNGRFRERYWRAATSPLSGADGTLVLLLQEVEEVTNEILGTNRAALG